MQKYKLSLGVALSFTTAMAIFYSVAYLGQKQAQKSIPSGWAKTLITIKNIDTLDNNYAYTVGYPYQIGEEIQTIEQYILDDRKPKKNQAIAAIYCQEEPVLFELLEPIQYE
jgi:hypothetical protein